MIRGEERKKRICRDVCVFPARLRLSFLVAIGVIVLHMSRMNLHIAVTPMIQITNDANSSFFGLGGNVRDRPPQCSSSLEEQERFAFLATDFVTTQPQQPKPNDTEGITSTSRSQLSLTTVQVAALLGSFYCGYILSPIVGGRLADLYGTKRVFGGAIFVDTLVNLITPMAVKSHYVFLIVLRLGMGLFQGSTQPSLHSLLARWIPPTERPRFIAFSYLAYCVGMPMIFAFHTMIISHLEWESVFYISGCISLMWLLMWTCLMYDDPNDHPRISSREIHFISTTTHNSGTSSERAKSAPWRQMASSSSLLAISIAHTGNMFGFSMIINQFPVYFQSIFGLPLRKDSVWFFLPAVVLYVGCNLWAGIDSQIAKRRWISKMIRKKLLVVTGFLCPAVLFVTVGYIGCNIYLAMSLCVVGIVLQGAAIVGYGDIHLHIAPNFAGTCFGLSEMYAFGLATLGPLTAEYFTHDGDLIEWQIVFWVIFLIYCFCALFFVLFVSFETQSWNTHSLESPHAEEEMITKLTSHRNSEAYS